MEHPSPDVMAAYVDGSLSGQRRGRLEAHLASCAQCVDEVADLRSILGATGPGWRRFMLPLAAAATIAALLAVPAVESIGSNDHRAPPTASSIIPPTATSPVGTVRSATPFTWRRVPDVDRYRITVFDTTGTAVWTATTEDSTANVPDSVIFTPGMPYLWRIEARLGFDRWIASDLERFEIDR